jgi:hypothetical protein
VSERASYSRVYWSIVDDPKFVTIYDSDTHLAAWLRLLLIADQAHPASAHLPSNVRRSSVKALAECELIDLLPGSRYRVHGLDAERERRRLAATSRPPMPPRRGPNGTQTVPEPGPLPPGTTGLRRDETRRGVDEDETSLATPQPPSGGGRPSRANGTNQRAEYERAQEAREAERLDRRRERNAIEQAYYRGELLEAEMERAITDLGKNDDDLSRFDWRAKAQERAAVSA